MQDFISKNDRATSQPNKISSTPAGSLTECGDASSKHRRLIIMTHRLPQVSLVLAHTLIILRRYTLGAPNCFLDASNNPFGEPDYLSCHSLLYGGHHGQGIAQTGPRVHAFTSRRDRRRPEHITIEQWRFRMYLPLLWANSMSSIDP